MSLPAWFQGEIPTELLRLARANVKKPVHRQILADWVERYGGEEGQWLCRFLRRDAILRHDASTWQTLSASEARLVPPFSDLVLGIGDRLELPLTETQNITLGWVPPGDSWLGGGDGQRGKTAFTLTKGLWCGIYPVTQEQWLGVMGNNPSHFQGMPNNPVEQVSYIDVQEFLQKVNAANSRGGFLYCLPSADEWEYIIRGGPISKSQSQYHFYFAKSRTDLTVVASNDISSTLANYNGKYVRNNREIGPYLKATSAVGTYLPNPLGMYDMHGNVCEQTIGDSGCVVFGGGWSSQFLLCMAASKLGVGSTSNVNISNHTGFRILAVPLGE